MNGAAQVAVMLIGLGGLAAGVVGLLLPASHKLSALLALVAGAGVGVVVLSIGVPSNTVGDDLFLVASATGFVTVVAMLVLAWQRAGADR